MQKRIYNRRVLPIRRLPLLISLLIIIISFVTPTYAAEISNENSSNALPVWTQNETMPSFPDIPGTTGKDFYVPGTLPQQQLKEAEEAQQANIEMSYTDPFSLTSRRIILMLIPVGLTLLFLFLWAFYGRKSLRTETVEFYPPEGLDPSQMGFIYRGLMNRQGIASMAVYYANKGFLAIDYSGGSYTLRKIREYDGDNPREKAFFRHLFGKRSQISEKDFYRKFSGLKELLWEFSNQFTIFVPLPGIWGILTGCMGFAFMTPLITQTIVTSTYVSKVDTLIMILYWVAVLGLVIPAMLIGFRIGGTLRMRTARLKNRIRWKNRDYLRAVLLFCSGFVSLNILTLIAYHPWRFVLFTTVYWICFGLMAILLLSLRKRTPYGNKLLGKILGFKRFLEVAEKDRLEKMFDDDSEYYYTILPYTYVLGVSNTWIDNYAKTHT